MSDRAKTLLRRGLPSAVFLVLALLLVLVASVQAFPDVPAGHAYKTAIDRLSQSGIIGGYQNGDFGLNDPVKRAQFAKMIVGALEIAPSSSTATRFTDLGAPDANGYPHKYVQAAYDNGITTGTNATQTLFAPWSSIRRDQVVSMIVRGIERLHPSLLEDPPAGKVGLFTGIGEPHGQNLRIADNSGLLDGLIGIGPGWSVTATATRGEVAHMLHNLLTLLDGNGSSPTTSPPTTTPPTTAPSTRPARDVWVYADGSGDYPTIEAAVAALGPGSTIRLGKGTFTLTKTLAVDYALDLVGSGWQTGNTLVTYAGVVVDVRGAEFRAENVRFVNTATTHASCVLGAKDAELDLQSCCFSGGKRRNDTSGSGVYLYGTTTATVSDCVLTKNDLHGIAVEDEAQATLEGNTCTSNSSAGILLADNAIGTVRDNYCSDNGMTGVAALEQSKVTIDGNTCRSNAGTGILLYDDASGTIRDNECTENEQHGICLTYRADAVIEYNACTSNAQAGICFLDSSRGTVRHNECTANRWGIYVVATAAPVIESNNDLHSNTVSPQLYYER
ncbi:MAG: right-handed parallel beta-helix repeat-containing protein [Thermoleophilia bacterium]|nr:right-handed parallel beta-helix repeat-containing protein [Thermoleophilia bacterium]